MRSRTTLNDLSKGLLATLVVLVAVECLLRTVYFIRTSLVTEIPLPYVIGQDYGPIPPWQDGLRILEPDDVLFWRARRNLRRTYVDVFSPVQTEGERTSLLRRFLPALPASLRESPRWEISLNSEGFRDAEFPTTKSRSSVRIICLGDSWTFGANVGQRQAYPQRLKAQLTQEFPGATFEVLNLGVLGYSSYQGLELLKRRAVHLQPDLVVIGFAMNDASVAGYRDKDLPASQRSAAERVGRLLEHIEAYKLLRYAALVLKNKPASLGEWLRAGADSAEKSVIEHVAREGRTTLEEYEKLEPWTRVAPGDYERNMLEMIRIARTHRAGVILLHNELWRNSPYATVLERIARGEGVPLVDSSALIVAERARIEQVLERKLGLTPPRVSRVPTTGEIEVIFRVYAEERHAPKGVYLVGAHPKLGNLIPNRMAMRDDGTQGDQRAGDHVWSYSATFPPGTRLFYVYTTGGSDGKWEGLDVPLIRGFMVEAAADSETLYRPIESFGRIYMLADGWHPDATGYDLIARAVLEQVTRDARVKGYLEKRAKSS